MIASGRRTPTPIELERERTLIITEVADTAIVVLLIAAALASGSLTMLGEATRGALTLGIGYYSLWLLRAVHRNMLKGFQFGTGKIEQFAWVVVGLGMVLGALWVGQSVFRALDGDSPAASPLGLSVAAIFNALNFCINWLSWRGMRAAAREETGGVLGAELSARRGAVVGTGILQVTLTLAVFAKDPGVVLLLDSFGALLVVFLMLRRGLRMISAGLSSLFDQPADPDRMEAVRAAVEASVPERALIGFRTRRGGDRLFVEVAIDTASDATTGDIENYRKSLQSALRSLETPVDLVVVAS
ncbi:cation transporter [Hoeflea sp. CAU 1731]